jgi:cyclophilin family peptidyl-prolyl cis-trans isomerase/HEAT repeat protein/thiol-disulfide isomerase/thioredoxin
MRRLVPLLALLAACTATPPPPPAAAPAAPALHGFTIEEEARILALEDRREYDAATVAAWVANPNSLHRQRIALALGRIGTQTFADVNGNGERDPGEKQAGVDELIALASDADPAVRTNAAFALGEIGDAAGAETLLKLAEDENATTASEAVEGLSKMTAHVPFARYAALTVNDGKRSEGVRARAVRHLYRYASDEASALAASALDDPSVAIRTEAAYVLARRPYAAARERLELLTNDPATMIRAYAAAALGRIAAPESAPVLVLALGDAHPWVRTNAVIALARVAAKDATVLHVEDLPRLFAVLEDPDPGVRASTIDTLGYYSRTNETAKKRLNDIAVNGTRWERELATGAIAKHLAGAPLPAEMTSWAKVRVLEATGGKRFADDPDPNVRANALSNIPDDQSDAALDLIRTGLTDADVIVRANAVDRYSKTKDADRVATLQSIEAKERTSTLNDARLAAISAVAEIDFPERESWLRGFLKDKDPVVRRVAADSIEQKLKKPRPQFTPLDVRPVDYAEIVRWSRQPHTATIHMTRGLIQIALLPQEAPMTAWNFATLAKQKYFDNSSFMRVVPNFVIQGGDPRNDMNGGPGYAIRDEINLQKYTRGAVGMALSGPDTGGSQFFITHSPQPHLDGGYTIFGRVYDGMTGVVDQTERGDRVETIAIDEHAPATAAEISSVGPVSLPLEIGRVDAARLLARVPDYAERKASYKPDETVLEMVKDAFHPGDRIEVYMGTWCSDSQREVPKFLRIVDELKSRYGVDVPVSFVAVDRAKQKPADLLAGKHIEKVATFIYYRGETELGRIVEKPASLFEDDLLVMASK